MFAAHHLYLFIYTHRQQCYASNEYKHGRLEDIQSTIGTMQARRCLLPQLGEDNNPMEEVDDEQMHRSNESLFVDDEQEKSGSPSTTKIALTKVAATNQCHSLDVDTSGRYSKRIICILSFDVSLK